MDTHSIGTSANSNHNHHESRHKATTHHKWSGELKAHTNHHHNHNEVKVYLEHKPEEFPMLMTAAKSEEDVVFDCDVSENEHVHIERSVSQSVVNISNFDPAVMPKLKQLDEMQSVIDRLKEKKPLGDDDMKRISIILNVTNDIKELCKEGIEIMASDIDVFYRLIREKWDNAVNEINELNSKIISDSDSSSNQIQTAASNI